MNKLRTPALSLLICLVGLMAAPSVMAAPATSAPREGTVISFAVLRLPNSKANFGWPTTLVTLNGKTATFLLDTGFNFTGLTDGMSARLDLTSTPLSVNGKPFLVNGKQTGSVTVTSVQVGPLDFGNAPFPVIPDSSLTPLLGQPVDGVIGANFLSLFAARFDFARRQLTLWRGGNLSDAERAQAGFAGAEAIALTTPDDFKYTVRARLASGGTAGEEDLLVDTGSLITRVSPALAQKLHLTPDGPTQQVGAYKGSYTASRATVTSLGLGATTVTAPLVYYTSSPSLAGAPVLGLDVLSHYVMLLDLPAHKMYLLPAAADPPRDTAPAVKK